MRGFLLLFALLSASHSFLLPPSPPSLPVPLFATRRPSQGRGRPPRGRSRPRPDSRTPSDDGGTRLNKCLTGLSRREADAAIAAGRVLVNRSAAEAGVRVRPGDEVTLDGKRQRWEAAAGARRAKVSRKEEERAWDYIKYWKPAGVTSTTDAEDASNILTAGGFRRFPRRVFPVGRLDKESTGLILLTSDGRIVNALLDPQRKQPKVYEVTLDRAPSEADLQAWSEGVVITTPVQGRARMREVTAKTLPCNVRRLKRPETVELRLVEGRNRQIRKMCAARGLEVRKLHRTQFAGIGLRGLSEGAWELLDEREMAGIIDALDAQATSEKRPDGSSKSTDASRRRAQ